MISVKSAGLMALMVCLGACKPAPQPAAPHPTAAAPAAPEVTLPLPAQPEKLSEAQEKAYMTAIFEDRYNATEGKTVIHIGEGDEGQYLLMTPVSANQLDDGRIIVIVNGMPTDETGEDLPTHPEEGVVNIYTLRRAGGMLKVVERRQNVTTSGSFGNIGDISWIMLAPNRPGFMLTSTYTGFGDWISNTAIFELGQELRELGGFSNSSSNSGTCGSTGNECWDVDSTIRFAQEPSNGLRDLLVSFTEKHYTQTEGKDGAQVDKVLGNASYLARYHFDGKTYQLVSGKNPTRGL